MYASSPSSLSLSEEGVHKKRWAEKVVCVWRMGERWTVAVAVEESREKEVNASGVDGMFSSPSEEERMKRREQLINRLPLNVSVYTPECSPSSSASTLSRKGTNKREMGVSSSVVNVHPLSDIQSEVDGVIDASLYPFIVSELEVQRMLCWIGEEVEEEGGMEEEERWKDELVSVREVESSMDIIPSRVSLNVHSLTSALHSLIRIRDAFQLHTSRSDTESEINWDEEEQKEEEEERSEVVLIEH